MFETMGANGGYVLAAVHNIQPDVPPENVVAMFAEGRECVYSAQPSAVPVWLPPAQ